MWVCALFFGTFVNAATLKTKVSPVQKVIELLDDLSGKVKGDLQNAGGLNGNGSYSYQLRRSCSCMSPVPSWCTETAACGTLGSSASDVCDEAQGGTTYFKPRPRTPSCSQLVEVLGHDLCWPDCPKVSWVANKRFVSSKFKFKFPRARNLEIIGLLLGCIEAKFASKYSLESSRRDLHNALLCTVIYSQIFVSKTAELFAIFR